MGIAKKIISVYALVLLFLQVGLSAQTKKNVLLLNSYNLGYTWTDQQIMGFQSVFDTMPGIEVYMQFMDTRRFLKQSKFYEYFDVLLYKFKNIPIDAIITNDNDALDLILNNRKNTIFKSIPVVFTGITNITDYDLEGEDLYGVYERPGMVECLKSIEQVFPTRKTIHVITDQSTSGRSYKEICRRFQELHPQLNLVLHDTLSTSNLREVIGGFEKKAVVYYLGVTQDAKGNKIDPDLIPSTLVREYDFPVFSAMINEMPGILGGDHRTGQLHAIAASNMLLQLLSGKKPEHRIIVPELEVAYDYRVMQKFGVKVKDLPEGTLILNEPETLFQKHKVLVIGNSLLLLFLIAIIGLMIRNSVIQRKYRMSLRLARDNALQSDKLKSAFLANVSHEFRTPLNAIVGFSDLLVEENTNEDLEVYIRLINRNADLLTQLINDVLDLSLMDAKQIQFDFKPVDLKSIFEGLHRQISRLLADKGKGYIELVLGDVPDLNNLKFFTDELRFNQMLINLLQNATKFTQKGFIEFGCKVVDKTFIEKRFQAYYDLSPLENYLYVYVKDTGIGIPQEMLGKVFDRFTRVDNKIVKNIAGTGLGLSICDSVITNLGGRIEVESTEGEGSEFYFYLPFNPNKGIK